MRRAESLELLTTGLLAANNGAMKCEAREENADKQLKAPNIDEILERCGDFHRYQILLLGFFCLVNILCSMHYYSQTIISFIPEHW